MPPSPLHEFLPRFDGHRSQRTVAATRQHPLKQAYSHGNRNQVSTCAAMPSQNWQSQHKKLAEAINLVLDYPVDGASNNSPHGRFERQCVRKRASDRRGPVGRHINQRLCSLLIEPRRQSLRVVGRCGALRSERLSPPRFQCGDITTPGTKFDHATKDAVSYSVCAYTRI